MSVTTKTAVGATLPSAYRIATDEITQSDGFPTGYQVIKLAVGDTGSAVLVSSSNPLPVSATVTPSTAPVSITTSTATIGAVLPSSQWTVTTTPSSQIT